MTDLIHGNCTLTVTLTQIDCINTAASAYTAEEQELASNSYSQWCLPNHLMRADELSSIVDILSAFSEVMHLRTVVFDHHYDNLALAVRELDWLPNDGIPRKHNGDVRRSFH